MKTNKKAVTYRIPETTIEQVRREARDAGQTINKYVDAKLSKKIELKIKNKTL